MRNARHDTKLPARAAQEVEGLGVTPRPLTERQLEVYAFIRDEIRTRQLPPTLREIAVHFGFQSTNGVRGFVDKLVRHGLLRKQGGSARGLLLTAKEAC